ncbi:MAG TPA: tripartite tricarboxylate transporter substrate binding protein [Burkholderiales bacterium]|nr:tripartite tricarboxylate transporter substrate binding protein [Burkholderiales bacterium]
MMKLSKLGPCLVLLGSTCTWAQQYPVKPVRVIVGFTAGGPSDIVGRIVAQQLTERMGRQFVVENRVGATGMIGAEVVAKAPPDGYLLYIASQTTHAVAPYMYSKPLYDPVKDFATVSLVAHNPLLMVVHPSFNVKTVKELIALAKAQPGAVNYATGGIGSSPHMSMELLKSMAKIDMVPIHYKGDGAAVIDLIGGQVPIFSASIAGLLQYVKTGKLRGIAVTGSKRSPIAPEFPTIAESGLPGFEVVTWFGVLTTAGAPADVINRLHGDLVASLGQPAVKDQINKLGLEIVGSTPEQYATFLRSENVKWGNMVRQLKLKAD